MKLNEAYNLWVVNKGRQVKISSMSAYTSIYSGILAPEIGDMEVSTLNKKVMQDMFYRLLDSGRSAKYCNDILIVFRMIMRFAAEELDEEIPDVHWRMVFPTSAKRGKHGVDRYSQSEYKKIVDYAIENPSPKNLGILLTICTGMRIGEICGLRWEDIDLEKKVIKINRTIERIYNPETKKTEVIISSPKTSSSNRSIPIVQNIFSIIKKFHAVSRQDYYVCSGSDRFIEPRTYRNYYKDFIINKVKLANCIKFHGLRHTFATVMIENKVDVKTTSLILGHSDVSTTLNIYVHPSEEAKRNSINSGLKRVFR